MTHYSKSDELAEFDEEEESKIQQNVVVVTEDGKVVLKQNIIEFAKQSISHQMRKQVSELIALLGKEYLYRNWVELVPGLFQILDGTQDPQMIMFVFETIKRICKKYRTQTLSYDL